MARLPTPGGDQGNWGDILNDFLKTSHNDDGTIANDAVTNAAIGDNSIATTSVQDNAITANKVANGAVTQGKIADGSITPAKLNSDVPANGEVLSYNGTGFEWVAGSSGDPAVGGDLTGTASNAQIAAGAIVNADVSGTAAIAQSKIANLTTDLGNKANDNAVVHLTGNESIAGTKTFSAAPAVPDGSFTIAKTTNLQTTLDGKAATSHTHAVDDLSDASVAGATDGQSLVYQAGTWIPATVTSGGGVTDHGALTGLVDDDHTQYHTDARGDARYYTQSQVDTSLAGKSNTGHGHAIADVTNLQTSLDGKANNTVSVTGTNSITGGGDLSANRTVSLVNDNATPGNDKYYGTNGTGTKGYYDLPSGGGDPAVGGDLTGTASNAQIAAGAIVNADVSGTAAIAQSKIANLTTDLGNKANATHTHAAADINSGTMATARLGSGTADGTTFLRGDGTWATPPAGGGSGQTLVTRSANTTAAAGEYILADASSAGFNVTLPDAQPNGTIISVKKIDASVNGVIIVPQSGTIEGNASIVANQQWESWDVITDGTSWYRM